jgi:hypothetical protein
MNNLNDSGHSTKDVVPLAKELQVHLYIRHATVVHQMQLSEGMEPVGTA